MKLNQTITETPPWEGEAIRFETHSAKGHDHDENHDSVAFKAIDDYRGVAVVADGVGSNEHPRLSSLIAASCIAGTVAASAAGGAAVSKAVHNRALRNADHAIALFNGATTAVVAGWDTMDGLLRVTWLGDSNAYLVKVDGTVVRLTVPMNLAHAGRPNVITGAVGDTGPGAREPESIRIGLDGTVVVVLVTDGADGHLELGREATDLARILQGCPLDPGAVVDRIVASVPEPLADDTTVYAVFLSPSDESGEIYRKDSLNALKSMSSEQSAEVAR